MQDRTTKVTSLRLSVAGRSIHARAPAAPPAPGAPAVVLMHGLTVSSRYMVRLMQRLAPHAAVYALDMPGFGRSAKPSHALTIPELADALVGWMDAAGLPSATLVGQSMGCQIIADAAARYPWRADALALIGPSMDRHGRTALEQARRLAVDALLSPPSAMLIMLRDLMDCGVRRTLRTLRNALADRIEDKLPLVGAPALVIRGGRDVIAPQCWVEELVERLPDGELAVVPGAPHATQYVAPDATTRLVMGLLARRGTRAPAG